MEEKDEPCGHGEGEGQPYGHDDGEESSVTGYFLRSNISRGKVLFRLLKIIWVDKFKK